VVGTWREETTFNTWPGRIGLRARELLLVYRWVQDEEGDWGSSLWVLFKKKAQFFPLADMQQFSRSRYMQSWPVSMKSNSKIDRRNMWVYAPIVRRHWKHFMLSERLLRSISARRRRIISLPDMWWDFIGSPDMPVYEVMRSPMSLQGATLVWVFLDPSRPWGSLDETHRKGSVVG
jgi:hypothetical protein